MMSSTSKSGALVSHCSAKRRRVFCGAHPVAVLAEITHQQFANVTVIVDHRDMES